jgi:hypothetical protein
VGDVADGSEQGARSMFSAAVVSQSKFDDRQFTQLWAITAATYGVGDIVTTVALIWFSESVTELNAAVLFAVDAFGLPGFVALKLVAFAVGIGVCLAGAATDDWVLYYLPPAALSVVGVFATTFNIRLLIG